MGKPYSSDKRIAYHLDGTRAFYRVYNASTVNKINTEYIEITPDQMEFMNRSDGSTSAVYPLPVSSVREITFFFPDVRAIASVFASIIVPVFANVSSGVSEGSTYEVWTSSDTTGLDDGTWIKVGTYSFSDSPLAAYRQQLRNLIGEGIISVKAFRIRHTLSFTEVFDLSKLRVHLYGHSIEPSPLGGLYLVKSDGSPLTLQDLYVGSLKMTPTADQAYEEISFKVRNTTTKTASNLSVDFDYVLPHSGTHLHDPIKMIKLGSGAYTESPAQSNFSLSIPDLPPEGESEEIRFKMILRKITEFTVPQWGVLSPIIIRPKVGAWV